MKKGILIVGLAIILLAGLIALGFYLKNNLDKSDNNNDTDLIYREITNFEECVKAGNPVMESYPRQCAADGKTFTEVIIMSQDEAREIAQNSACIAEGELTGNSFYNDYTKTWWFDLDIEKTGCSPACVVNEATREAEINWRCTGLIEE